MGDPQALHQRLLAEIDSFDALLVHKVRFNNALRAVVELHRPIDFWADIEGAAKTWWVCDGCERGGHVEYTDWPCKTVTVVAEELGVSLDV